jgi:hypothetical protein
MLDCEIESGGDRHLPCVLSIYLSNDGNSEWMLSQADVISAFPIFVLHGGKQVEMTDKGRMREPRCKVILNWKVEEAEARSTRIFLRPGDRLNYRIVLDELFKLRPNMSYDVVVQTTLIPPERYDGITLKCMCPVYLPGRE